MSETTAELSIVLRVKDLASKTLNKMPKSLTKIRSVGVKTFKALGRSVLKFAQYGSRQIAKFVKSATGKLKTLAKFSLVGGALATAGFGSSFLSSAIEFEESASKFQAVFKGAAADAVENVRAINRETGASIVELTRYFGNLQDTFVPMGYAVEDAAKLSSKLTRLGIDVASFGNRATDDVLRDFQSALVGNTETVRKYGVVITEARLKQEAYRLGLAASGTELSEQVKLQSRLSLLFKGTTDAQGDAIRTLDSTANVFRRLRSSYEELKVVFGTEIAKHVQGVIDALGGVEGVADKARIAMGALTFAANAFLDVAKDIATAGHGLFGALKDTDGIASLLSGNFERVRNEAVKTASEVDAAWSKFAGLEAGESWGHAAAIAEQYDRIPRELKETLGGRLVAGLNALGGIAYESARNLGLNIKKGILDALDGFEVRIPNPVWPWKTIGVEVLDFSDSIKDVEGQISESTGKILGDVSKLSQAYFGATQDMQSASVKVTEKIGESTEGLLKALTPDESTQAKIVEQYRGLGAKTIAAFKAGIGARYSSAKNSPLAQLLGGNIKEVREIAMGIGLAAQGVMLQVVESPVSVARFAAAGLRQWNEYERSAIEAMSQSQLPSRVQEFFSNQERQIAEQAAKQIVHSGGAVANEAGEPTKQYLALVRQLRQEFQGAGASASGAFKAGVLDAVESLGNLADQAANAGQAIVQGFNSHLADGFNDIITKAKTASEAWEAFRESFKQTIARIVSDLLASRITSLLAEIFGSIGGGKTPGSGRGANSSGVYLANGGVVSGSMGTPMPINAYAQGGIASSPQVAIFGEGRGKEAFVPLPNHGKIPVELNGGSGGTVNLTIQVQSLDPRGAADVVMAQIDNIASGLEAALQGNGHRGFRYAIQGVQG